MVDTTLKIIVGDMKKYWLASIGVIVLVSESLFVIWYLPTARESVEVMGAYSLLIGSFLLLLGLLFLATSNRYRFWIFTSLSIPGVVLLIIAYACMVRW